MILLEPIEINGLHLKNRAVMLATHLGYCSDDGKVNDRLIEFYTTRARYKPGLIVVGGCYTEPLARSGPTMIGISNDTHLEGLGNLVTAIHEYEVPVAAQLYHAGRYSHPLFLGETPVSASAEPSRLFKSTPRPLKKTEIKQTVENFGLAAARAKDTGFNAVEIIGSAGYLINQFLARATNKRRDEYNGDLHARARFAIEVVDSVRSHVGNNYPIFYRLSGEDFVEKGNTLADNRILAPWLVDAGVDCINVTGGWHETHVPQTTMDVPRGHYAYLAEAIAEVVQVPVVACNRINSPTVAESILKRGKAKLIGMSRGFIADPEFMEKVRTNREHEIRNCIGCNLGCLDKVFLLEPVICAINPLAGYESERPLGPSGTGHIAVVGGGPSGMEAARVLAIRGFS
ncbi:MAG: NADH:flavin oxidoreductase, partial [Candidatus Thorarchaeota archaeon]